MISQELKAAMVLAECERAATLARLERQRKRAAGKIAKDFIRNFQREYIAAIAAAERADKP